MGTRIFALIEYDDSILYDYGGNPPEPFLGSSTIDLTRYDRLWGGKDYQFFAAIAGVRTESNKTPLITPRGLPPNPNPRTLFYLEEFFDLTEPCRLGWLTLAEIQAALHHMELDQTNLSLAVNVVLEIMKFLEKQLGPERVRLVFVID